MNTSKTSATNKKDKMVRIPLDLIEGILRTEGIYTKVPLFVRDLIRDHIERKQQEKRIS